MTSTDWPQIFRDLKGCGMTMDDIAAATQIKRERLFQWKNHGIQPLHDPGERLIALWSSRMDRLKDQSPKRQNFAPKCAL